MGPDEHPLALVAPHRCASGDGAKALRNGSGPARAAAPYVLLGLVAFLARLLPTLRGGRLSGPGVYDDAVYYPGVEAPVAGRVPGAGMSRSA